MTNDQKFFKGYYKFHMGQPKTEVIPDQIIHEARGLCWHEPTEKYLPPGRNPTCKYCNVQLGTHWGRWNPDYSKWENYGPMLEVSMTKDWWEGFVIQYQACEDVWDDGDIAHLLRVLLNPARGRDAIATFLKEHKP